MALRFSSAFLAVSLPVNLLMIEAGVALLTVSSIWAFVSGERYDLRKTPLTAPILCFSVVALASAMLSPYPFRPLQALSFWPMLFFFPACFSARHFLKEDRGWLGTLGLLVTVSTFAMSVYAMIQHYTGLDFLRFGGEKVLMPAPFGAGTFKAVGNFNRHTTLAFSFIFPFSFASALVLQSGLRLKQRLPLVLFLAAVAGALAFSYCRAVWLGFVPALMLAALFSKKPSLLVGALGVCMAGVIALALDPSVRIKAGTSFDLDDNEGRVFMWSRTIEMIRDHPVTGIGFGNYKLAADSYYDRADPSFKIRCHAHNLALHFLAETGPFGLFAFVWIWAVFFGKAWKASRSSREIDPLVSTLGAGALTGVTTLLIGSFAQDPIFDGAVAFMLWTSVSIGFASFSELNPRHSTGFAGEN